MKNIVAICKALSDRNRLRVVAALMEYDELCACQLVELLQVSGATASRHLGVLISSDLVVARKEGRWVYYRLQKAGKGFQPLLRWLREEFDGSLDISEDLKALRDIVAYKPEELCRKQRGGECCPDGKSGT